MERKKESLKIITYFLNKSVLGINIPTYNHANIYAF